MKKSESKLIAPWLSRPMPGTDPRELRVGDLTLRDRFDGRDYWLAHAHGEPGEQREKAERWMRWPLNTEFEAVSLSPLFPDRPLVLETETPLCLSPGSETRIYARCPLWARVELLGRKSLPVCELPSVVLSNTWFGAFTDGVLGYWVSSRTRTEVRPDPERPWLAVCPVWIRNRSDEELKIERLCLRGEHLSLFAAAGQLWADETQVVFRGPDNISRLDYAGKAPAEAGAATRIAPPRARPEEGFAARTFATWKNLRQHAAL